MKRDPLTKDAVKSVLDEVEAKYKRKTLKKWLPIYDEMVMHEQSGLIDEEIAKRLHLTVEELQKARKMPEYKERSQDIVTSVKTSVKALVLEKVKDNSAVGRAIEALTSKVPWAVTKLVQLAADGESSQRIQLDACKEILDRANVKSPDHAIIEHREAQPSGEELLAMKQTLTEIESIRQRLANKDSDFVKSVSQQRAPRVVQEPPSEMSSVTDESSDFSNQKKEDVQHGMQ